MTKTKSWLIGSIICVALVTGCGAPEPKPQTETPTTANPQASNPQAPEPQPSNPQTPAPQPSDSQTPGAVENRYEVAGIEHPQEFEAFFTNLQKLVADGDTTVAEFVSYPINVNLNGKKTEIKSKDEFIKQYDQILTQQVKDGVAKQVVGETFVNAEGVSVGEGVMWLNASADNPKQFWITAINN